jgi:GNAT superfamily N-acetyltransferase
MPTISLEPMPEILDEIRPLLTRHWQEIATYPDIPLDPDFAAYDAIERAGLLVTYTVRENGVLIGYALFIIRPSHMHYKGHGWAINDIVWLSPEHRGQKIGEQLMDFVERDMAMRGIAVLHMRTKVLHPHLARLLDRRGYRLIEYGHEKRL